jgi:hypothetical protein
MIYPRSFAWHIRDLTLSIERLQSFSYLCLRGEEANDLSEYQHFLYTPHSLFRNELGLNFVLVQMQSRDTLSTLQALYGYEMRHTSVIHSRVCLKVRKG